MPQPRRRPRRSTPAGEHRPVLLQAVLETLRPQAGETLVDCTLGFAGHAHALLERVGPTGLLLGFDLDGDNLPRTRALLEPLGHPFQLFHSNFAAVPAKVTELGLPGVDCVLADLGMSSMQVDDALRGFSYSREGPLDMRMDRSRGATAADLLRTLPEGELVRALEELGDEPAARAIAAAIVAARPNTPTTTGELAKLIAQVVGQPKSSVKGWRPRLARDQWKTHPAARSFQALRILVNRELANLTHLLRSLPALLKPGGRVAIISFHSGEDRLVKAAFKEGVAKELYSAASGDPIRATFTEKQANPRSRSAKLRWAIRA